MTALAFRSERATSPRANAPKTLTPSLAAALNSPGARPGGGDTAVDLEGVDFLGWQTQSFDTDAGPLDVVPFTTLALDQAGEVLDALVDLPYWPAA